MRHVRVTISWLLVASLAACGGTEDGGPVGGPDAAPTDPGAARLHGEVTRSAEPQAGGIGHIYIAVFDRDPVVDMDNALTVASGFIEDADLSGEGASVGYEVTGIPVRSEPYYLVAFMDDNGTVDPDDMTSAGPDKGDLISLRGLASPSVTLDSAGDHAFDIDLNSVLPF